MKPDETAAGGVISEFSAAKLAAAKAGCGVFIAAQC
jgi:hypothetical protein